MEAYDKDFTDEELELLLSIDKKRKKRKLIILIAVGVLFAIFITLTISALVYNPAVLDGDIVERYPF